MSRRAPSIFDPESMSVEDLKPAAPAEEPTDLPVRKVGRPPKTTAKPKPTPFYIHPAVKEVLRDIAYHERCKEHDLFVEGLNHVLKKRAYGSIARVIANAEKP
jgi:hypothetical protein